MKLQLFDGGVSTRQEPQLLNVNQGVVYENIDNAKGSLTPLKDKLVSDIAVLPYHFYDEISDTWLDSNTVTDYVAFQRRVYLTNRVTRPSKYSNGVYTNLGITRPTVAPITVSDDSAPALEMISAIESVASGDLPFGPLDYLLFNVNDDVYSAPLQISTDKIGAVMQAELKVGGLLRKFVKKAIVKQVATRSIDFKDLLGDLQDSAKLYRRYDGNWRLLHTFVSKTETYNDGAYDISANELLDETKISSFYGTYQYVYTYYNATDGVESAPSPLTTELVLDSGIVQVTGLMPSTDPQVTHKRLYRVGGDITEFTLVTELVNSATSFTDTLKDSDLDGRLLESDNYYEAPTGLKFLSESYAMLFGAVGSSLRFTPVGKPDAWPPEYELQFDADITGIGAVANGLLVFTRYKTYIVTGTGPTTLSPQLLRGDQGCIAFESIQSANLGTLIWASADGLYSSSGNNVVSLTKNTLGYVALDPVSSVVHNELYYCHNADGSTLVFDFRFGNTLKWLYLGVDSLVLKLNTLYGYYGGLLYSIYGSSDNLTFKYLSPRFVEGAITEIKLYKKVYFRSKGDIIIKIIIDDAEVITVVFDNDDTNVVMVPQDKQRGYSVQFSIEGTGSVQEIEYVVGPRQQNG